MTFHCEKMIVAASAILAVLAGLASAASADSAQVNLLNIFGNADMNDKINEADATYVQGIIEGKKIGIVTLHPFRGPVVIRVEGKMVTLGRGLANRIIVELTE
jgi:succinyl-CoA synthetase beta subunit